MPTSGALSQVVYRRAHKLGFLPPRIVNLATVGDQYGRDLDIFLARHYHGTMTWLAQTRLRRQHPKHLWPEARSALVCAFNYGPQEDPLALLSRRRKGNISVYARHRDYHDVMKGRLKELAGLVTQQTQKPVKVFVDTAPLMEKPLAMQAGVGWQGKHTHLVNRQYGAWLLLGIILMAADLPADMAEPDHCGSCRACLDICPTDAFPAPYQLDARKCISYLTIEHKGAVSLALRAKLGNRIYGCDDCLAVCPWNKFAQIGREAKLQARSDLKAPDLAALVTFSETEFRQHFSGSPIKRIGWAQFIRNVLYAIGNSQSPDFIPAVQAHLHSPDMVVRDAAQWAIKQLYILKI